MVDKTEFSACPRDRSDTRSIPVGAQDQTCKRAFPSLTHALGAPASGVEFRRPSFLADRRPPAQSVSGGSVERLVRVLLAVFLLLLVVLADALPARAQATLDVPSAPQSLSAVSSDSRVDLQWAAPASNGGSDILRYEVRRARGATVPENELWISVGPGAAGSFINLTNGTQYSFEVRAVNAQGAGPAARIQVTPGDLPTVSVSAERATVTEGADAEFRISRTGSTAESLSVGVDISGHKKIMSAATRTLVDNTGPLPDTTVAFGPGVSEVTLRLTSEADRVNEGDGEISVTIPDSPDYEVDGTGAATVLVEDDDIPEVTLRWVSPTMTLQNNVWVGSMVEGQDIEFEVVCSGNTLAPEDATHRFRIPMRFQELLNHPVFTYYGGMDHSTRFPCVDQQNPGLGNIWRNGRQRYVGPDNGRIEIDLFEQVLNLDSVPGETKGFVSACYGSPDDIRFCPKFTLGAVTSARIEVRNRNPTITVEALDDEVNEGEPARFRLTRIWTSDWLNPGTILGASTIVDYTTSTVGDYVVSPPSGQKTFAPSVTEIIVEIPTVNDSVAGEDGMVTFELLPGSSETQSLNIGGHYEVHDQLDGITPPGKSSRAASVRILNSEPASSTGVALTVLPSSVAEDAGATAITVTGTLNEAPRTAATAVTVTVSAGTAGTGDFAAVADFALTIAAGESAGTASFTLTPVDDSIDEDDETVSVSGTAQGLAVTGATVTVADDDGRGITVSSPTLTVPEGASRTYTVVLRSQPTGNVTVTPSATGSADVTVSGALTFTAETWNRAQAVTVSAAEDADAGERRGDAVARGVGRRLRLGDGRRGCGDGRRRRRARCRGFDDGRDDAGGDRPDLYGGAQVAADWPGDGDPVGGGQRGRDGERRVDLHRGDLEPGADGDGVGGPGRRCGGRRGDGVARGVRRRLRFGDRSPTLR